MIVYYRVKEGMSNVEQFCLGVWLKRGMRWSALRGAPLPVVWHERYSCPWPEGHRFVMSKFAGVQAYAAAAGLLDACEAARALGQN